MRRVILIFTLVLFTACMAIPPSALAERNSNNTAAFDRDDSGQTLRDSGQARMSTAHKESHSKLWGTGKSWGESLRSLFNRYFITILPGTGITVIDVSWNDQDGPLEGDRPPGWKSNKPTDQREVDEHGWDDNK